jgi:hypothetical protein
LILTDCSIFLRYRKSYHPDSNRGLPSNKEGTLPD